MKCFIDMRFNLEKLGTGDSEFKFKFDFRNSFIH